MVGCTNGNDRDQCFLLLCCLSTTIIIVSCSGNSDLGAGGGEVIQLKVSEKGDLVHDRQSLGAI